LCAEEAFVYYSYEMQLFAVLENVHAGEGIYEFMTFALEVVSPANKLTNMID